MTPISGNVKPWIDCGARAEASVAKYEHQRKGSLSPVTDCSWENGAGLGERSGGSVGDLEHRCRRCEQRWGGLGSVAGDAGGDADMDKSLRGGDACRMPHAACRR